MSVLYAAVYFCAACLCLIPLCMCFYCRCVHPVLIYRFFYVRCVLLAAFFIVCLPLSVNSLITICLYMHFISVLLGCLLNIWQGTTDVN